MGIKRINFEERELISNLVSQGKGVREIARHLSRSPSTISTELRRFHLKRAEYKAVAAQEHYCLMKRKAGRKKKIDQRFIPILQILINDKYFSPHQVSEFLKHQYPNLKEFHVSHETIYQFIYASGINFRLRRKRKGRRKRGTYKQRPFIIPNRVSIRERPKEVNSRVTPGHWEGDLIIGKNHQSAIGTLVERASRLVKIVWIGEKRDSESVLNAFAKSLEELPSHMKQSLTYDNGIEAYKHEEFTKKTGMSVYFADPGCPWQRGTNENTNGLIREFFPKSTELGIYDKLDLKRVEDLLNERPRKILNFASPKDVFNKMASL
ncbi:Transposase, IS30 family [Candidatus Rubidus massiliensis]|nr:Transposase, IS30 family [Candidatus Rubidus massiliensis]CDZ80758.1 Transposase, IS30 family [Candidatus Rubidus massiliensis]